MIQHCQKVFSFFQEAGSSMPDMTRHILSPADPLSQKVSIDVQRHSCNQKTPFRAGAKKS